MSAIAPISVAIPVRDDRTPHALDHGGALVDHVRSGRRAARPLLSVVGLFVTAALSPVSDASWTRSALALSSRASAPTASPSARTRTSPRTSSAEGTVLSSPSRSTVDCAAVIVPRAATASSALASWVNPSTALSTTIAAITMASTGAPSAPSTIHARRARSRRRPAAGRSSGSWNWASDLAPHGHRLLAAQLVAAVRREPPGRFLGGQTPSPARRRAATRPSPRRRGTGRRG